MPGAGADDQGAGHGPNGRGPTIESIHANVEWANKYRLELIKLVMTLAAGILAFTVSFRPTLTKVESPELMWMGWIGLGLSLVGGMVHMHGWDRFYISYRDHDWKGRSGKVARDAINMWRGAAMMFQYAGFAIGVITIALFAVANIGNVAPPK